MPKSSEIEIGPGGILIPDVDADLIESLRLKARLSGRGVEDIVPDILACAADVPRERFKDTSVIWLDDEP
jgi:hypothetical protein